MLTGQFRMRALSIPAGSWASTPSQRIQLKARIDLGDQTAESIPFEVISTAIFSDVTGLVRLSVGSKQKLEPVRLF
jgi:hypothetical protein